MFEVLFGGAETTVQDMGRHGCYRLGICPSGAQDNFSFRAGNILVKNRESAAALEITVVGPRLRVLEDTMIAFTGADLSPKVNNRKVDLWEAIYVRSDDIISFGGLRSGCRTYLCVAGGIDVPLVFGSRSTGTLNKIGGYRGRKLETGDLVRTRKSQFQLHALDHVSLPDELRPFFPTDTVLRAIPCGFDYLLTPGSFKAFFRAIWTVGLNSNRVGYTFEGPKFYFEPREQPFGAGDHPSNVVDIPYPIGSIQIPGGQNPILLLNDAVTGGGFAIIGTVIKPDLDSVAQLKPGDRVEFKNIGIQEALRIKREKEAKISEIKKIVNYPF
jgi:biotin-dependent carboxylase-like uncharacterized protein